MPQTILENLKDKIPNKISLPGSTATVDLRHVDKTIDNATDLTMQVSISLLVVTLGWLASRWLASATQKALVRARVELTLAAFLGSLTRYTFFLMCMVSAFRILGVSLTSMVTVFGAIGLALAFALRSTLSHVAAGLMLIVNRPFKVGDFIELEKMMGTVKRITLFNTEINTLQNQRMFIPNSRIWESILMNHTYNEVRVMEFTVDFSYDDIPEDCKRVLREVFAANELVLSKPEPYIETVGFMESSIRYHFRIACRTRDFGALRSVVLDQIWHAAKLAGLTIPYPQRVVQMTMTQTAPVTRTRKEKA